MPHSFQREPEIAQARFVFIVKFSPTFAVFDLGEQECRTGRKHLPIGI